MNKSMYSLMLMDDVVRAVDHMAHVQGTNRSNLINQILAEYLSVETPQQRITSIFDQIMETAQGIAALQQVSALPSGTALQIRSALNYKYNPTVRYQVEISTTQSGWSGEFRASVRTSNAALLTRLGNFFQIWSQIERFCLMQAGGPAHLRFEIAPNSIRRGLNVAGETGLYDEEILSQAIVDYIALFDGALTRYFEAPHGIDTQTYDQMIQDYQQYLQNRTVLI